MKRSSDSFFSPCRAPEDGNWQQAEQAATGNRQHGSSVAGIGNCGILNLMFINFHGIFATELNLRCNNTYFLWSTEKKLRQGISLVWD